MKKLTVVLGAGSLLVASSTALAETSANVGITSNYVWRGVTQTSDDAAVSGGIDYAHASGFYVGGWASNVSWTTPPGTEIDFYLGFSGTLGEVGYDVGFISYNYPSADTNDFEEIYVGASFGPLSAKYSWDDDNENGYLEAALEFEVRSGLTLGIHFGDYDFDLPSATDYSDFSVSVSKDAGDGWSWSLTLSDTDLPDPGNTLSDDDPRVVISVGKEFGF